MELNKLSISEARDGLRENKFSSVELTKSCLAEIKKSDKKIHAFLNVTEGLALKQAGQADKLLTSGKADDITGIPIAIKDAILVKDEVATGGSKILENYIATYDAFVIERLNKEGAVIIGKTNLDEFAMGSSTENSGFEKTRNPWDLDRVPGGSSGGSAAAVAANMCAGALGSDTGGSIRQPASLCGIVGLKTTYGRVSRYGLMAMTSSLDQIGPMTKTAEDSAYLLKAIAANDPKDSTNGQQKNIEVDNIYQDIKGMTIGIPEQYFIGGMDAGVETLVKNGIKELEKLGAKVVEVSLPLTKHALSVYYLTVTSEVSSNLARYDGIRYGHSVERDSKSPVKELLEVYKNSKAEGFGSETKRRIIMGTYALSAGYYDQYYVQAQKVRTLIRQEFNEVFKKVDCLVSPTSPSVAFKIGEKFEDPLTMYLSDIYTVPANIGSICAVSFPCGLSEGLPVGLQIMGKPYDEEKILKVAHNYEKSVDWQQQKV